MKAIIRRILSLKSFLLLFALAFSSVSAHAQILNVVLNGLLDRVDSSIQHAGAVADHLEIQIFFCNVQAFSITKSISKAERGKHPRQVSFKVLSED